jgi:uncharacterized protein
MAGLDGAMPALSNAPLTDDEYDLLVNLLEESSHFDADALLGMLNAIAVAPGMVPPSAWLELVMSGEDGALDESEVQQLTFLLLRLQNEVLHALNRGKILITETSDVEACQSFAAGFAAGAALDPSWLENDDHWSFAEPMAYLGGRFDLVGAELRAACDVDPDRKDIIRRDMAAIIGAAQTSFTEARRAALRPDRTAGSSRHLAGRNDPCPCGSGKKYKRCCL